MDLTEGVGESSSPPRSFGNFNSYDIRNDVFNRLVEIGCEEAIWNSDFRDNLDAHFNRLPASYALDVNVERVEDVLLHQKLLEAAKDPEKRPVYHIRFLEQGASYDAKEFGIYNSKTNQDSKLIAADEITWKTGYFNLKNA